MKSLKSKGRVTNYNMKLSLCFAAFLIVLQVKCQRRDGGGGFEGGLQKDHIFIYQ